MPTVKLYNQQGEVLGERELDPAVFGVRVKPELIQLAIVAQEANARPVVAHTKDRSQVAGGGKKPWKQKHTGRARHGSIRSPIWVGGGVTFGPNRQRNFSLKLNRKVRQLATRMALSDKVQASKLMLLDDLDAKLDKTKAAFSLLGRLGLRLAAGASKSEQGARSSESEDRKSKAEGTQSAVAREQGSTGSKSRRATLRRPASVLVVTPAHQDATVRALRNLPRVAVIAADSLNVRAVVQHEYVLTTLGACERMVATFAGRKSRVSSRKVQSEVSRRKPEVGRQPVEVGMKPKASAR